MKTDAYCIRLTFKQLKVERSNSFRSINAKIYELINTKILHTPLVAVV